MSPDAGPIHCWSIQSCRVYQSLAQSDNLPRFSASREGNLATTYMMTPWWFCVALLSLNAHNDLPSFLSLLNMQSLTEFTSQSHDKLNGTSETSNASQSSPYLLAPLSNLYVRVGSQDASLVSSREDSCSWSRTVSNSHGKSPIIQGYVFHFWLHHEIRPMTELSSYSSGFYKLWSTINILIFPCWSEISPPATSSRCQLRPMTYFH